MKIMLNKGGVFISDSCTLHLNSGNIFSNNSAELGGGNIIKII